MMENDQTHRPQVVIVGGGFAGIEVARRLRKAPVDIVLIDKRNHHLFQPLLYQVATAGLSPADISSPLRTLFKKQTNIKVLWREVLGVDHPKQVVLTREGEVAFDYLVIATGSEYDYFGNENWKNFAPHLKTLEDATKIRKKILTAFEMAEDSSCPSTQKKWMTFVLVGAGSTGVELAGSIAELARHSLKDEYRNIHPKDAKIIVVEAGSRVLGAFSEKLSLRAAQDLHELGVEVRLQTKVVSIESGLVRTNQGDIETPNIIWTAGVRATGVAQWLGTQQGPGGRIRVDSNLEVPEFKNVYVIGDAALSTGRDGKPLPCIAPVAISQGKYLGRQLAKKMKGQLKISPFVYFDKGMLATIGRARAVAQLPGMTLKGLPAWLVWALVHILYLVGFENRVLVMLQWIWYYFSFKRGVRLIAEERDASSPLRT